MHLTNKMENQAGCLPGARARTGRTLGMYVRQCSGQSAWPYARAHSQVHGRARPTPESVLFRVGKGVLLGTDPTWYIYMEKYYFLEF